MGIGLFTFKLIDIFCNVQQNGICDKYKKTVKTEEDIKYSDKGSNCLLNIHYRSDSDWNKKRPVCIHIHGGGFVAGGKKYRRRYPKLIADLGFFVVNADYDLCPNKKYHEYIPEFIDLFKWVKNNAEKYNYDPQRILVTGDSSGGHCSSVLACLSSNPTFASELGVEMVKDINISNTALMCGCYDIKALFKRKMPFKANLEIANLITGVNFKGRNIDAIEEYKYYKQMFTTEYITNNFPKTFLAYVKNDFFCLGQGEIFEEKLKENNIEYTSYVANRFGDIHCFHLFAYTKSSKECIAKLKDYLKKEYSDLL